MFTCARCERLSSRARHHCSAHSTFEETEAHGHAAPERQEWPWSPGHLAPPATWDNASDGGEAAVSQTRWDTYDTGHLGKKTKVVCHCQQTAKCYSDKVINVKLKPFIKSNTEQSV